MARAYYKDSLIKDITSHLTYTAKRTYEVELKVQSIELTDNFITFYFESEPLIPTLTKQFVENLHRSWNNLIFQGKKGYYKFGDILHKSTVNYHDNILKSVRLPFYKIECLSCAAGYHNYYDFLPYELNMMTLIKFKDKHDLIYFGESIDMDINDDFYKELVKFRSPILFDYFITTAKDLNIKIGERLKWSDIDFELMINRINENKLRSLRTNDLNIGIDYYFQVLLSSIHIKMIYPKIYAKFKNGILLPENWIELLSGLQMIHPTHPLYSYVQTGKIPEGYILKSSYIDHPINYTELLIQMIKEGVKIESPNLYKNILIQKLINIGSSPVDDPGNVLKLLTEIKFPKSYINEFIPYFEGLIGQKSRTAVADMLRKYRDL